MIWRNTPIEREPFSYRSDPAVPRFPDDRPIIIFDGNCILCSGFAQFILRRDRNRRYRLLVAQTPIAAALYRHFGLDPVDYETNLLLENGRIWLKSEGSIRMIAGLGFPWSLISIARLIPRPLRDRFYDAIARNRFRWFGKRETCYAPNSFERERFIA